MATTKHSAAFLLFFLVSLVGCGTDDDADTNHYLVKSQLVMSYSQSDLVTLVNLATIGNPELADFVPKIITGVRVYYVEYLTDYTNGKKVSASGFVSVPATKQPQGSLLLSFQNGTIVLHSEAPTKNLTDANMIVLHAMAGMGLTVCVADNLGFGASEQLTHPYLHKKLFQASNINLIRAVKELEANGGTELRLNGQLYFMGYSLGGWASLVAHKYVEDNGLDGFTLSGSACGAGSYNLDEMKDYLFAQTNYVQPYYLPLLLWGYASTGDIEHDMSLFFAQSYALSIQGLMDGKHNSGEINAQLTSNIPELMSPDLVSNPMHPKFAKLRQVLADNSQPAWVNQAPLRFYHGTDDVHVPYTISQNLVAEFRSLGQGEERVVSFTTLDGANHRTGSMPMFLDVLRRLVP